MSELFQASGAVTMNLLFEKTSNLNKNTLGWYDPDASRGAASNFCGTG